MRTPGPDSRRSPCRERPSGSSTDDGDVPAGEGPFSGRTRAVKGPNPTFAVQKTLDSPDSLACGYRSRRVGPLQGPPAFRSFRGLRKVRPCRNLARGLRAPAHHFAARGRSHLMCVPRPNAPNLRPRDVSRGPAGGRAARSRFGYDHRWWGEARPRRSEASASYWAVTRRPLPCLVFVAPLLLAYELGVLWIGGREAEAWRTGADAWMRHGLAALGLTDHWFPPLCLAIALLAWQAVAAREWRFSPLVLLGMAGRERRAGRRAGGAEQARRPRFREPRAHAAVVARAGRSPRPSTRWRS